jgi:hypothetical protein
MTTSEASEKTTEKIVATSLKLPASVKAQIDAAANKAGITAHAYMVKILEETAVRAKMREEFEKDSQSALRDMKDTGLAFDFDDAKRYFKALALYRQGGGPKPERPAMVRLG